MFAVIETGGKQYKVQKGDKIKVEKLEGEEGGKLVFSNVLLTSDKSSVEIGAPYIKGKEVEGKILKHARGEKKIVFKYHSKARYRKKKGHRQEYVEVEITNIPA